MLKNANVQVPDTRTILLKCTSDAKSISENVLHDFSDLIEIFAAPSVLVFKCMYRCFLLHILYTYFLEIFLYSHVFAFHMNSSYSEMALNVAVVKYTD